MDKNRDRAALQHRAETGLKAWFASHDVPLVQYRWSPVDDGRTSHVWLLSRADQRLICKLSQPRNGTPLFPNDVDQEISALTALDSWDATPAIEAVYPTSEGVCLILGHCEGRAWSRDVAKAAATLSALHCHAPPDGLRSLQLHASDLLAEADHWATRADPAIYRHCLRHRPVPEISHSAPAYAFLHGDPVPGNMLETSDTVSMVDWQCPATGHPAFDLAVFTSPAMQVLAGNPPLTVDQLRLFLTAYGAPDIVRTFISWRAVLAWRIACHCALKIGQDASEYRAALTAELALLERLNDPDHSSHQSGADSHVCDLHPTR